MRGIVFLVCSTLLSYMIVGTWKAFGFALFAPNKIQRGLYSYCRGSWQDERAFGVFSALFFSSVCSGSGRWLFGYRRWEAQRSEAKVILQTLQSCGFVIFMGCLKCISSKSHIHELYLFLARPCISQELYYLWLEVTRSAVTSIFMHILWYFWTVGNVCCSPSVQGWSAIW